MFDARHMRILGFAARGLGVVGRFACAAQQVFAILVVAHRAAFAAGACGSVTITDALSSS